MARVLIRTVLVVLPFAVALCACIGPSKLERIAEDLNAARAAATVEARVEALERAKATTAAAQENPTGEVAEWVELLLVSLLAGGGGVAGGAALRGRQTARSVVEDARSLPNRAPVGAPGQVS
jgi:hypothetical protein